MNHPPSKPYSGLTIVLSNPSRFDIVNNGPKDPPRLLKGNVGEFFRKFCVGPEIDLDACHVFDVYEKSKIPTFINGTKCVLLCGAQASNVFFPYDKNNPTSLPRGTVLENRELYGSILFVITYTPQDTFDTEPWENLKNPLLFRKESATSQTSDQDGEDNDSEEDDDDDKNLGKTSPANYAFWLEKDTKKAIRLTRYGQAEYKKYKEPKYDIYIPMEEILEFLLSLDGQTFGLDIETDSELNVNTLGFGNVHRCCVVPFLLHDYRPAYSYLEIGRFFVVLQKVLRNPKTTLVIHNSLFDLFVLAYKYNIIPLCNIYDTMLVQHRMFPETEKSLGHCISMWTCMPYHKDEGIFEPMSSQQSQQLWNYNGKDVVGMMITYHEQRNRYMLDTGLISSVELANNLILPYLWNTFCGICLDTEEMTKISQENERLLIQYQRIVDILVGPEFKLLPTSPKGCVTYFHDLLKYPPLKKSKKTKKVSVDSETLYKLKLAHPQNITIDFCLKYREVKKETGSLKFTLWTPKAKTQSLNFQKSLDQKLETSLWNIPLTNMDSSSIMPKMENQSKEEIQTSNQIPLSDKSILTGSQEIQQDYKNLLLTKQSSNQIEKNLRKNIFWENYSPNRATTGWKLAGTKTFRLSSAKLLKTWGTNLQNPNKNTLQIFRADKNKEFGQVDQAGAEALIVAYLTPAKGFRELFLQGIKSHNYVALHLFIEDWIKIIPEAMDWLKLPPKELKEQPRWKEFLKLIKGEDVKYYIAKKTCHSANYGMQAKTFTLNILKDSGGKVVLTIKQAEKLLETYHNLFPEIRRWHIVIQQELARTRTLRNLFGHPRYFNGNLNFDIWQEAYAFIPQSTVGTITNYAFIKTHNYIIENNLDWDLLNNKHDSLLVQFPKGEAKEGVKIIQGFLEQDLISPRGEKFKMKSEASIGFNWGKYDEKKNPEGLRDV